MTASQDTSAPGCASAESAPLPIRLHHAVQQQHALGSGIGPKLIDRRSPYASASRGMVTFVAGRSCGEFGDSSPVPPHAQSRAELEPPRARVPYTAGCKFSPTTVLRALMRSIRSRRATSSLTRTLRNRPEHQDRPSMTKFPTRCTDQPKRLAMSLTGAFLLAAGSASPSP